MTIKSKADEIRRLLARGEFSDADIAALVGTPVATVYGVRSRLNRPGRASFVDGQMRAVENRMADLERIVHAVLERLAALEAKAAKTRR